MPAPGRRPDSLFDNRYRYDYIYPRGRSGETLRAYDTVHGDQPVVIKRPALQDAPPMRAGQEVSILNEKRALEKLSGHPVLTELRHAGTFRVGGQTHHYIAMDMAQGETVESMVLDLAARGDQLPDLEMLVIFDLLLDLLQTAHDRKIVYNDVDAKHLFWDRNHYRLKVIDWGNAVFLESDNVPPHTNRSSDIFQTGQLLYFVVSGGRRLDAGRTDPAGDLGDDVPPKLKVIINKACHPEPNQRYADIGALRQDLAEVRKPIEKSRDSLVERVRRSLPGATSQDQLEQLQSMIAESLRPDPGFPAARGLAAEIESRLQHLSLQGDLDAVRIYILSGNMDRASHLLEEIFTRVSGSDQPLLNFLLDACALLQAQPLSPLPTGLPLALDELFQEDATAAGKTLVTTLDSRPEARLQQFLLAERLTLHIPGVVLLRPHLARIEDQLSRLSGVDAQQLAIQAIYARLDDPVDPGIQALLRTYQDVSDTLIELQSGLKAIGGDAVDSPYAAAVRAQRAADDIIDLLDVVMHNILSDPTRAGNGLWHAASIDPVNPAFDTLSNSLNIFHADLDKLRAFSSSSDGSDVAKFLIEAQSTLKKYALSVTDGQLQAMLQGVNESIAAWMRVVDAIALGGRRPALVACQQAADAIRALNVTVARWFESYYHRIEEAPRVEYLSPNAPLGHALSDGWEAWDRGRAGEAQASGEKALAIATTESEKRAARRLVDLGEVLGSWLTGDGAANVQRTEQTEERVSTLFLPEEESIRRKFSDQMPNTQIYLKAMSKGVVDPMRETSSVAVRALFLHYVLRGVIALQQEKPDEANFWKEASLKTLGQARLHPAFQALDTAIVRRQLILDAVRALNNVKSVPDLTEARQAVRAPIASSQLEAADQAVRAVDDALRRWPDGEFRSARQLLDSAVERIAIAETAMGKDLTPFKTWLQDLTASAEVLQGARRVIEQAALVPSSDPDPAVSEALQKLVEVTRRDLGEQYVAQLRQWRDTYNAIRDMYVDKKLSKDEKLRLFESHFASLFMERQPALPIFRHWQGVVHLVPDPKPVYDAPSAASVAAHNLLADHPLDPAPAYVGGESQDMITDMADAPDSPSERSGRGSSGVPTLFMAGAGVLVIVAAVAAIVLLSNRPPGGSVPFTPVNDGTNGSSSLATVPPTTIVPTNTVPPPTATSTIPATNTDQPTSTPPTLPPTITRAVPTPTTVAPTATNSPPTAVPPTTIGTPTSPPTLGVGILPGNPVATTGAIPPPTLLADATAGDYDLLQKLGTYPSSKINWNKDWFGPGGNGWQLGTSQFKAGGAPQIVRLGPDVMTYLVGAEAARKITRMDATMELAGYEKAFLPTGQVFFGAGFESLQGQRAAVQATLIQAGTVSLGMNLNGKFVQKTQFPVNTVRLQVSIQRNSDNTLLLYVDNQLVGQSNAAYAKGTPVTLYFYTSSGGVIVNITSLSIHLES